MIYAQVGGVGNVTHSAIMGVNNTAVLSTYTIARNNHQRQQHSPVAAAKTI